MTVAEETRNPILYDKVNNVKRLREKNHGRVTPLLPQGCLSLMLLNRHTFFPLSDNDHETDYFVALVRAGYVCVFP